MRRFPLILLVMILGFQSCTNTQQRSSDNKDQMDWWREARFGMFIHWGLYAIPAGEWGESTNHAEWIRTTAQVPLDKYNEYVSQFNPVDFDADKWVEMARDAGMKYIVITSKHHDGFCLFDSEYTDFDIMSTPFKRDILKELSQACEKYDIKMCWYHSIMDWHHPDYLPRRSWEIDRSEEGADFERYIEYMKNQLKELTTNYGEIGVLWFDGEWESSWTHEMGIDLYDYVSGLQEGIIINNRVDKGRNGMEGMTMEGEYMGDFGTPEQEIPAKGLPGVDWETCLTMNNHWGYNRFDSNWKSEQDLIRNLVDISSKGGNFLLNVGPEANGAFPEESILRLKAIGDWMGKYSESIYGTSASPFGILEWGRCTSKKIGKKTRLYLHVFDAPESNTLLLPGIRNRVKNAFMMDSGTELNYTKKGADLIIDLPGQLPDSNSSVVIVDIVGTPETYDFPLIIPMMNKFVGAGSFGFENIPEGLEIRYTADGSEPSAKSDLFTDEVKMAGETVVKAAYFLKNKRVSGIISKVYSDIDPAPPVDYDIIGNGLVCRYYNGSWDSLPEFKSLKFTREFIAPRPVLSENKDEENYALTFDGYIYIPENGMYTFSLSSDDGSIMYLDNEAVILNDGLHGSAELKYDAALAKGYHLLKVEYFQKSGGSELTFNIFGQGIKSGTDISSLLFH